MGTIKESCDPEMKFPSSLFFGSDFPYDTGILLDDTTQKVVVRNGDIITHVSYDEWIGGVNGLHRCHY